MKKFNQLKQCQKVLVSQEIVIKELRSFIAENLQSLLKYIDENQESVYQKYYDNTGSEVPDFITKDKFQFFDLYYS
jgi:hypothetical protein